nr:MAG TPA_asm: hypothetical protein [Caudoviricetes sp.]
MRKERAGMNELVPINDAQSIVDTRRTRPNNRL